MRTTQSSWSARQLPGLVGAMVALAGCGGGGGDANPVPPAPTLVITSSNADAVAHDAATGILALPISLLTPGRLTLAGGQVQRDGSSAWPLVTGRAISATGTSLDGSRKHALTVIGTGDLPCNFGGTLAITINDADSSGNETPGDIETLVYKKCVATATETYDGTMTLNVAQSSPSSATYRVTLSQLSYATPNHSLVLNGTYVGAMSESGSSVTINTMTVDGSVAVAVSTHVPFADTVTMRNGFVVQETYDSSVAAPPGSTVAGQSVTTASGTIESTTAGGAMVISAVANAPITKYSAESYPRSGAVKVTGKTGTLWLNALSATSVRVDLDSNDDGTLEATTGQTWDWAL
jgi:hypothetical protein